MLHSCVIALGIFPLAVLPMPEHRTEVLVILQRAGLAEKFVAVGLPMKGLRIVDAKLEEFFAFSHPPVGMSP